MVINNLAVWKAASISYKAGAFFVAKIDALD
jgi:hypothetical protein